MVSGSGRCTGRGRGRGRGGQGQGQGQWQGQGQGQWQGQEQGQWQEHGQWEGQGCSSPGGGVSCLRGPPHVRVQGTAILLLGLTPDFPVQGRWLAPRMSQSRGRHLASWPGPRCSSPGQLAGPPDVPVQGAGPPSCFLASFGLQPPGCSSPGGRYLASWPRPGCSSPGPLWLTLSSSLLRSAAPRMLQSRGRFILSSRGSGKGGQGQGQLQGQGQWQGLGQRQGQGQGQWQGQG